MAGSSIVSTYITITETELGIKRMLQGEFLVFPGLEFVFGVFFYGKFQTSLIPP
jgi:hypothetical protein